MGSPQNPANRAREKRRRRRKEERLKLKKALAEAAKPAEAAKLPQASPGSTANLNLRLNLRLNLIEAASAPRPGGLVFLLLDKKRSKKRSRGKQSSEGAPRSPPGAALVPRGNKRSVVSDVGLRSPGSSSLSRSSSPPLPAFFLASGWVCSSAGAAWSGRSISSVATPSLGGQERTYLGDSPGPEASIQCTCPVPRGRTSRWTNELLG
jgi:hypothetical protein